MKAFKTFIIFTLSLIVSFSSLRAGEQKNYFSDPNLFSSEQFQGLLKEKSLEMCWHFEKDSHFCFETKNNEVYFEIVLGDLPSLYRDLVARIKERFIELAETKQIAFSYKRDSHGEEEINILQAAGKRDSPDESSYIVSARRVFENAAFQLIDEGALETIIRENNILFYTGAGLSADSDVPTMSELYQLLELEEGEAFLFSLEKALIKPYAFASKILAFHKACFFNPPTRAHLALKELALFKNVRIITENLDCLHERSGICPYRIDANQLRDEIGGLSLSQFDYIICVGLSYDDRGFLGWYKEQNPEGKIIAIDLKPPSYLGNEDFLVRGHLQEIVPSIQKKILQ